MTQVHVTALSFESPLGNDWTTLTHNLRAGTSGVRRLRKEDVPDDFPVRYAAKISPCSSYAEISERLARQLARDIPSGLKVDGLIGSYRELNSFALAFDLLHSGTAPDRVALDRTRPAEIVIETLRREAGCDIKSSQLMSAACVSGTEALGAAVQRIRSGQWERAIVHAIEIDTNPLQMMMLFLIGALSVGFEDPTQASRPFSKTRNGFVKGEAAGLMLLESDQARRERASYGELIGYATTSDAFRLTEGRPDGESLRESMSFAIKDAGLSASDIGYVKAHATSTPTGDQIESEALLAVCGRDVPVSSLKSQLGHSTHAAGFMETICSLAMIRGQFVAGNTTLTDLDPRIAALELNLVGQKTQTHSYKYALLNSAGFGGQNACLVIKNVDP